MSTDTNLAGDMRRAADTLETVSRIYKLGRQPAEIEISAAWLRREADVLEQPIIEEIA